MLAAASEVARTSRIESERIISILEDTTEKLGFLDSVTPDLLQHRDELSKFIGDEISRTMAEQRALEKQYEDLIEQRAAMKGMMNKVKYKEVQEEIQDVSRSLKESTNNLVRSLKENPNVSGNLIKVQRDRMDLTDLLSRCCHELRDKSTYQTISSRVDEEKHAHLRLARLLSREKELKESIWALQEKLAVEQRTFAQTTNYQRTAIQRSKEELISVRGSTTTDSKFKRKEGMASVSAVYRDFKLQERLLETKAKELEDKLKIEVVVHSETREFYVRKQATLLSTISTWENRYDTEIGLKDEETKDITMNRRKLLERLSILQKRKDIEIASEALENEKAAVRDEEASRCRTLSKLQNSAAKIIVREMREYVQRKKVFDAFSAKTKKGKKKGEKKSIKKKKI